MTSPSLEQEELPAAETPVGCVVALHGRGVDGQDLIPLAQMLDLPSLRFLFPHGPLPFEGGYGGRAWYPSSSVRQKEGIESSGRLLADYLHRLEAEGTPAERIALMGFSQGAVMSLAVGLRYPSRLAGIVALSGYLHDPEGLIRMKGPIDGLPVFVAHGDSDPVVPPSGSRDAAKRLTEAGAGVDYQEYPIGHEISAEEIVDIKRFLQKCFRLEGTAPA